MAWYDRPEGFTPKSFDTHAPILRHRNAVIAKAQPHRPCGCDPRVNDGRCRHVVAKYQQYWAQREDNG